MSKLLPGGFRVLSEALDWLYGTQWFGIKLGLEGMFRLAGACNLDLGKSRRFIHVAGTNGKGSTCAMLDSVCRAAGFRTGLYTSPHLVSLSERFQFNGEQISEQELCEGLSRIRARIVGWETPPTFFEIVTALGLEWFQRKDTEVVVLETGMGGRLDATNVVSPVVSVITPVGLDHQKYLGTTLEAVAAEKAGIIKKGVPCVSAPQEGSVMSVLQRRAAELGSSFSEVSSPWAGGALGLEGDVQRWNAALALEALRAGGIRIEDSAAQKGLAEVRWPGRFQRVAPDLVLDGAHNPHAALVLAQTWREAFGAQRASLIFGALEDKDAGAVLRALAPVVGECVLVPVDNERSLGVEQLHAIACEALGGVSVSVARGVASALAMPHRGTRLVTGSLYLVGEALSHLGGRPFEKSAQ